MAARPHPLLKAISLEGFLSFGHGTEGFPLEPLNVVIGPNGSGKSNLVEALSILRAVPRDLPRPIRQGGRVRDWLWTPEAQGTGGSASETPFARIEVLRLLASRWCSRRVTWRNTILNQPSGID